MFARGFKNQIVAFFEVFQISLYRSVDFFIIAAVAVNADGMPAAVDFLEHFLAGIAAQVGRRHKKRRLHLQLVEHIEQGLGALAGRVVKCEIDHLVALGAFHNLLRLHIQVRIQKLIRKIGVRHTRIRPAFGRLAFGLGAGLFLRGFRRLGRRL